MADNIFRSHRGRDPIARDEVDPGADAGDPLAELARLIGRSIPRTDRHERYDPAQPADDAAVPGLDWAADESSAPEPNRDDDRYAPPLDDSYSSYPPQDRGYANEPAGGDRFFSGSAERFGGFREEAGDYAAHDAGYQEEQEAGFQRSASFAPGQPDRYEVDDQHYDDNQAYAAEAYRDDSNPRRRGGLVVVVAVLGLAVLGTAGAFGYRAMFGGSVLPTLPPIIKPANGPNKIMPSYGDTQASNSSQSGTADASSSEKLVSHEEQPVEMQEAPRAAPRVVSTIPITPNQNIAPSGMTIGGAPFNAPAAAAPVPPAPAPASGPAPQMAAPAPPAPTPTGPKKVHTVTIRADQPAEADAAAAPAPPPAQRTAPRAAAPAPRSSRATPAGANQPIPLVPGASGDAAAPASAPRTHAAAVPTAVAAAPPPAASEAAPSSSGGYSVQVTSQRSEADAQAAFRALQAKYPNQLGGREVVVRRADLGAKGIYYRALVGPFASAEAAAGMCSSLKAAGGNCLVQRN